MVQPPTEVSSVCKLPILTPLERVDVKMGSFGKIGKMGGLGGLGNLGGLGKMGKIGKIGKMGNLENRIRKFAYIVGPFGVPKFFLTTTPGASAYGRHGTVLLGWKFLTSGLGLVQWAQCGGPQCMVSSAHPSGSPHIVGSHPCIFPIAVSTWSHSRPYAWTTWA